MGTYGKQHGHQHVSQTAAPNCESEPRLALSQPLRAKRLALHASHHGNLLHAGEPTANNTDTKMYPKLQPKTANRNRASLGRRRHRCRRLRAFQTAAHRLWRWLRAVPQAFCWLPAMLNVFDAWRGKNLADLRKNIFDAWRGNNSPSNNSTSER